MFNLEEAKKLTIMFPLRIKELEEQANTICDLACGISIEEIVHDSSVIWLGNSSLDSWLKHIEETILREHCAEDDLDMVRQGCRSVMSRLIDQYQQMGVPKFNLETIFDIVTEFKEDHIELIVFFSESKNEKTN